MKFLIIPFLMLAATFTANAHCGACGTGEAHAEKKACAEGCEKACCAKSECSDCSKDSACSKDKADCSKAACDMPAKKACAKGCTKPCCTKEAVKVTKTEKAAALASAAPLMPCCAKDK